MKKRVIPVVIVVVIGILVIISNLQPSSLEDNFDFYYIEPIPETEFISEKMTVSDHSAFVYATLSAGTSSAVEGEDEFEICVGEYEGWLKNQLNFNSVTGIEDKYLWSPDYKNIVPYPEHEIKKGSHYYGSVYVGIAPLDCQSISIDGVNATMKRMTFTLNGQPADFYLYYCAVAQNEYPDSVPFVCTTKTGEEIQITNSDVE